MGSGKHSKDSLLVQSRTWPTPTAVDGRRGNKPPRPWDTGIPLAQAVVLYPTPSASEYTSNRSPSPNAAVRYSLTGMARYNKWPTPTARDYRSGDQPNSRRAQAKRSGEWHSPNLNDIAAPGGQLNPTWVEWLMGFPLGWTDLKRLAIPSSRKSRKSSGGQS
ncbi:hypothetical protein [Bradyrhizobium sp.]|uniref:hypothetical protein n=1 Tax=Bradyrhizobium sp. TaxID=376 RepID=UPI0025C6A879|nr:hypothetical protein [Bradyrhizobium sp.]